VIFHYFLDILLSNLPDLYLQRVFTMSILKASPHSLIRTPLPINYPGSKATLMRKIVPLIPDHAHYISVFGGSAADILYKPRSALETYNDLNNDLVNMYDVIRDERSRRTLLRMLAVTPYSRHVYETCKDIICTNTTDHVERAWAYIVVSNQGRVGHEAHCSWKSDWSYRRLRKPMKRWPRLLEVVERVAQRFATVQIECREWEDVLRRYDGDGALFYLDPPYVKSTRSTDRIYRHEMSDSDHERLLITLLGLKGKVILSGYSHALYEAYLGDWRRQAYRVQCMLSTRPKRPERTEVLWMNFNEDGTRIIV
jgi:DNA adenine methylase